MKKIAIIASLLCLSSPAFATDQKAVPLKTPAPKILPEKLPEIPADELKERMALAAEFQKLRPIRKQIDLTIGSISQNLTVEQQAKFFDDIRPIFNYKAVEDASVKALAATFTVDELKAMVAFYSSPAGQSASAKMGDYEARFAPEMRKQLDIALTTLKYGKK